MRQEASIVDFLFDQEIRSQVKHHLHSWMFETNVYKALAFSTIDDQFDDQQEIDPQVLRLTVKHKYPSLEEEDWEEIDRIFKRNKKVSDDDKPFVLNILCDFIKKKYYWKGTQCLSTDKLAEADNYFTLASTLVLSQREYVNLADAGKVTKLLERKFPKDGKYIKSSFGIINDNSTFKGYRRQDLVMVVSPPGRGKTTFLCQEAAALADQGFKVGFAVIGDNEEDDISIKICSYYSRMPISEVIDDPASYIKEYQENLKKVNAISYAAGCVGVRDLLCDFRNIKKKEGLDVLIVDYDANLKQAHDQMYESGGVIYSALKAFAQIEDCVVMVASQPKLQCYSQEILTLESANESSKKQHAVDVMITFNWNPDSRLIGSMHLAKIRRGTTGVTVRLKFNYQISELTEISEEDYEEILEREERGREVGDEGEDLTIDQLDFEGVV